MAHNGQGRAGLKAGAGDSILVSHVVQALEPSPAVSQGARVHVSRELGRGRAKTPALALPKHLPGPAGPPAVWPSGASVSSSLKWA